jgi:hypothetical protein
MSTAYENGRKARLEGQPSSTNPHVVGFTKLGAPKLSEEGIAWDQGFASIGRMASEAEMHAARKVDVTRFRRKSNRFYNR